MIRTLHKASINWVMSPLACTLYAQRGYVWPKFQQKLGFWYQKAASAPSSKTKTCGAIFRYFPYSKLISQIFVAKYELPS